MEVCSYTLEEVFTHTWQDRYVRQEESTQRILEVLGKMAQAKTPQTENANIDNLLIETFSERKYVIDVCHKYLSPVLNSKHKMDGFIVLSKVKIIGEKSEEPISSPEPNNLHSLNQDIEPLNP